MISIWLLCGKKIKTIRPRRSILTYCGQKDLIWPHVCFLHTGPGHQFDGLVGRVSQNVVHMHIRERRVCHLAMVFDLATADPNFKILVVLRAQFKDSLGLVSVVR